MLVRPINVSLNCHAQTKNFRAFAAAVFGALGHCGLPPVRGWQSAEVRNGVPAALPPAVAALPESPAGVGEGPVFIQFELSDELLGSVKFYPDQEGSAFGGFNLMRAVKARDTEQDLLSFQNLCLELCRTLMRRVGLYAADLIANGGGLRCVPEVPLVEGASHLVVTNRNEVSAYYDDPGGFWAAGWERVEEYDGQFLVIRDMDVVCGPEYLDRLLESQWALARAAKPGETRYVRPQVEPEEEAVYTAGEPRLKGVGYSRDERLVEYSCALNPGEHIRGWEIFALLNVIERGHLSDGAPVETIRVVFLDQWAADQEKRPLLDIGCRVYHYTADGELSELTV